MPQDTIHPYTADQRDKVITALGPLGESRDRLLLQAPSDAPPAAKRKPGLTIGDIIPTETSLAASADPKPIPGLTPGRIVHFVLPDGPNKGAHRPAIIVRVWDQIVGMVQLQVFTDGPNDGDTYKSGLFWATSVPYGENSPDNVYPHRSWHWIEKA